MGDKTAFTPNTEDCDPLVLAASRLDASASKNRRPGLLVFGLPAKRLGGEITVTRSRFDGDYGNICRLTRVPSDGSPTTLTFAPTVSVIDAVREDDAAAALERLFEEWVAASKRYMK